MRSVLIVFLSLVVFSCEKDPPFNLADIQNPRLDSIVARESYIQKKAQILFGRSSGLRDFPVEVFLHIPDTAKNLRFYRSENSDSLEDFREFFPKFEQKNAFWQSFNYPQYEGDVRLIASYTAADTFYLSKILRLKHWESRTLPSNAIEINSQSPSKPRFRWQRDDYNTDEYLLAITDEQEKMLAAVILSDTFYRFYDVFKPFDVVGTEFTQPELIPNNTYSLYLMGLDTLNSWVMSYSRTRFVSRRE